MSFCETLHFLSVHFIKDWLNFEKLIKKSKGGTINPKLFIGFLPGKKYFWDEIYCVVSNAWFGKWTF